MRKMRPCVHPRPASMRIFMGPGDARKCVCMHVHVSVCMCARLPSRYTLPPPETRRVRSGTLCEVWGCLGGPRLPWRSESPRTKSPRGLHRKGDRQEGGPLSTILLTTKPSQRRYTVWDRRPCGHRAGVETSKFRFANEMPSGTRSSSSNPSHMRQLRGDTAKRDSLEGTSAHYPVDDL